MSKRTDTNEAAQFQGTLTVIASDNPIDYGGGNIELEGALFTDIILENTDNLGVNVEGTNFRDNYLTMTAITAPNVPPLGTQRIFVDIADNILKTKNNSGGIVSIIPPLNSKGDLLTHDGSTQVALPVGANGLYLVADNTVTEGIKWANVSVSHSGLTGLINDDHTQYTLLAGRSGGQILTAGTASGNNLTLRSTSNVTKGSVLIDETTASTSTTTGSLIVSGGVGISGALFAGSGNFTTLTAPHSGLTGLINDDHTQYTLLAGRSGGQILTAGTASGNNLTLRSTSNVTKGSVLIDETTVSTSTTTGSLIVSGGVGISGALFAGSGNFTTLTAPHSGLTGLTADDHTQYALLAGRSGGQILTAGTASSNNLTLRSTSNVTKGSVLIDEITASTSTTTGALIVSGGIGISNTTDAVSSTNGGTITTAGGIAVAKKLFVGTDTRLASSSGITTIGSSTPLTVSAAGILAINNTTNSISSTTGSITTAGGIGISNTTDAVSLTNGGTITTAGGVSIAKKLFVGGDLIVSGATTFTSTSVATLSITSSTASTSSTTGVLLLVGGIGINNATDAVSSVNGGTITTAGGMAVAKKLFVGTDLDIGGTTLLSNYLQTVNITTPGNPPASNIRFYTDSADSLLKSKNSSGIVTTYQPTTTKGDLQSHNGTTQVRVPVGLDNSYLIADSSQTSGLRWGNLTNVYYVYDQKTVGTNGGSSVAGSWLQRTLNTINSYPTGTTKVTLSGSNIIFAPGIYKITASTPFSLANADISTRLYNVTSSTVILTSIAAHADSVNAIAYSYIYGIITITTTSTLRLEYRTDKATASSGLGIASGFHEEKYSHIEIQLI